MGNEIKIIVIGLGFVGFYDANFTIHEPLANPEALKHEYRLDITQTLQTEKFDTIVLAVAHTEFLEINLDDLKNDGAVVYHVKGIFPNSSSKL